MNRILLVFFVLTGALQVLAKEDSALSSLAIALQPDTLQVPESLTYNPGKQVLIARDTIEVEAQQAAEENSSTQANGSKKGTSRIASSLAQTDAGQSQGAIDVSPTGAATYSVPFTLPPGIGNVVPQVGLVYNSQSGMGVAGYGWNISGLSAITRIPATRFHDNMIKGVNFDANDRFALDGQRLLLKSGTYGGDGAEYQTESFSNIRIFSKGVSSYGASYGPSYFEVWYPDGSKAFYGYSNDSRSRLSYAVSYSENPDGARISYNYFSFSGSFFNPGEGPLHIDKISYGAKGSATALNTIHFDYVTSRRKEKVFIGGKSFYSDKLLSKIRIVANGLTFRNYSLTHNEVANLRYQRLASIQESNGDETKEFDPISFTYDSNTSSVAYTGATNLSLSGIEQRNAEVITADFTGDGSMDFLLYPTEKDKIYTFWDPSLNTPYTEYGYQVYTGQFEEVFPVSWLNSQNKLMSEKGFTVVKYVNDATLKFSTYSAGTVSPVYLQEEKEWNIPSYSGSPTRFPRKFVSGDFNGDGLTDVVCINMPSPGSITSTNFINLDRRATSNFVTNSGATTYPVESNHKILTADFNGDGKTDILHIREGHMLVYGFNDSRQIELMWQLSDTKVTLNYPPLMGDFNGDGKADIFFPRSVNDYPNNERYAVFLSKGSGFTNIEKSFPFPYVVQNEMPSNCWGSYTSVQNIPTDIDGDGKTDIVRISFESYKSDCNYNGKIKIHPYHNIGNYTSSGSSPDFELAGYISDFNVPLRHFPIPVFLSGDKPNFNLEIAALSNDALYQFKFTKDMQTEGLIKSVAQHGVTHQISYSPLVGAVYSRRYDQNYPFIDIGSGPGLKVVSQLKRSFEGISLQQTFGYEGAVSHAEGLGFLGFEKTVRSNWHQNYGDENRMYYTHIYELTKRRGLVKSFTSKYGVSSEFTDDTSIPQHLSLSSMDRTVAEATESITLEKGFETTGEFLAQIVADPGPPDDDGATSVDDYITRTDYAYTSELLPNKVFRNLSTSVVVKDLLSGTKTCKEYTYDSYFNIQKEETDFSGQGSSTVEFTYSNDAGDSNYHIGRMLTRKSSTTAGSGTYSTEEQYSYTGHQPTQIKRKGHNTAFITENLTYDSFGNVISKSLVTADGTRTSSSAYDATGRFMVSATDAEGMTSTYAYDAATGNLLSKTNPYNQTDSFVYDSWGRVIESADYLGQKAYTSYTRSGNHTLVSQSNDEGAESQETFNALGQSIKIKTKNLLGQWTSLSKEYDVYGRLKRSSEPYSGSASQWNSSAYDEYGRLKQSASYTGKTTNITYDGLSSTVNDGTKSVTTTKNALGQVISMQDPGGRISYTYDAAGNMTSANYDGITQSITYDGWGRKTQLTDPSAGTYYYTYNDFGELTKEISPKGTTLYTYNTATGKLNTKSLNGDHTQMSWQYAYNASTKLLEQLTFSNADGNNAVYTYTYDSHKRPASVVEDNLHARFSKSFTYDAFGRINTETSSAKNKANNKTASKTLQYHYQNGQLQKVTDQATGTRIHEVTGLNARGQATTALMGSAHKQLDTYDSYGLPQNLVTQKLGGSSPATLMDLSYVYNIQRALLTSRDNSLFASGEQFSYDSQDRLTGISYDDGTLTYSNSHTYDSRGRISHNSQLGDYAYASNNYRQTELSNLTTAANDWYQNRALQQITYNAFKAPVEINEEGREKISFRYNAAMQRAHMYYGDTVSNKENRRYRRHYSEDGSMEITNDLQTGTTSFVFYLGGDAYSAPAIWKEVHSTAQSTQKLYFLHRDHQGSIVLITDNAGTVAEKRAFDAWGNMLKLQDGNGNDLAVFVILDRGYTGHEHLLGVALIHMNGRLYDPMLHRFLQPDNYVQDPYNTQNFNRYGYVLNNPLSYVDESGEFLVPLLVGALIGVVTNGINNVVNDQAFFKGALKSALIGGISGVASFGIGNAVAGLGTVGKIAAQTGLHGYLGGVSSVASGGEFGSGFLSGALGSIIGGGSSVLLRSAGGALQAAGTVASGALAGGIGAEIAGGNFWDGARNGAISAGLNHAAHNIQQKILVNQLKKVFDNYPTDGNDEISVQEAFSRVNSAAEELHLSGDPNYQNACATRLSLAFAKAGVKIPSGYGGLKDVSGNRIIISAKQMYNFMSTKYGSLMTNYSSKTSTKGIYVGLTKPGIGFSGHVTIIKPNFNSHTYQSYMKGMYFWSVP